METNKIYQTAARIKDDVFSIDTIWYDNKLWMVPEWIEQPARRSQQPARIVRIDLMNYQKIDDMVLDYVLNDELPEAALYEQAAEGFEILTRPCVFFPFQNARDLN